MHFRFVWSILHDSATLLCSVPFSSLTFVLSHFPFPSTLLYATLCCVILFYSSILLFCSTVLCATLLYSNLLCSAMRCFIIFHSTLLCLTLLYSALLYSAPPLFDSTLLCSALFCSSFTLLYSTLLHSTPLYLKAGSWWKRVFTMRPAQQEWWSRVDMAQQNASKKHLQILLRFVWSILHYSATLFCSVPFSSLSFVLSHFPLPSTLLYATLFCVILFYSSTLLFCSTVLCATLLYSNLLCSTMRYFITFHYTLLCSTLLYSALLYSAPPLFSGATLESRSTRMLNYSPIVSLKVAQSDKMPPRETHLGSLGLPKVTPKWVENDTKRHFRNWWRPHWANPIIYYVFGGSLAEKHIIYYVLTCSKKLFSPELYENLIIYYVLEPPGKSASLQPGAICHTPSPRPPPIWITNNT